MILRKPYAFLMKNFKLIHALLTALLGFVMYQTNDIYTFFKEYLIASRNLKIDIEPRLTSINWHIYVAVILIIAISGLIFTLMSRKKKPVKFYLYSMLFYFLAIVAFLFSALQISSLISGTASVSLVSAARDIMQMLYWGQYIFLFISILRTIGFNLKKFNFESDLKDFDILEEDNEEFEFEVGLDSEDVKTRMRRNVRMLKYFVIENKVVLVPTIVIAALVLIVSAFLNAEVYNKIYEEKETFVVKNLNVNILNTYETTKDYSGKDISEGKYIYYITQLEIKNETTERNTINTDNIMLKVGEIDYYSVLESENNNFLDLGKGYYKQNIEPKSTNKYILVFKVEKELKKEKKIMQFLIGYNNEGFVFTNIELDPKPLDKVEIKKTVNLKEELNIKNDMIGNVVINIEEYAIEPIMKYKYEEVINNKKHTFTGIIQPSQDDSYSKYILRLKSNITFKEVYNDNVVSKFLSKFGSIRYIKDGKEYKNPFKIKDVTPSTEKDNIYLEVYSEVSKADQIYFDITIREDKYIIKLK